MEFCKYIYREFPCMSRLLSLKKCLQNSRFNYAAKLNYLHQEYLWVYNLLKTIDKQQHKNI